MLFKEIIGQQQVKERLIQTVKENRVSHAQLFIGANGSGKLALAIAYAQYINCKNRTETDSCGICPSCIKYEKLIHPDLHFIYPIAATKEVKKPRSADFIESWRSILIENNYYISLNEWLERIGIENKQGIINAEDCNSIIKTLGYKSYEAEYKVMIIWMAEKLFHAAAPKILKILEEPPEKTLFILISENQDQIISTILSRTQMVKIPKIKDVDLLKALMAENEHEPDEIQRVVDLSEGNYKNALFYLQSTEIEKINFLKFKEWMRYCYAGDLVKLTSFVNEFGKLGRERQKSFFLYALQIARSCILVNFDQNELVKLDKEELSWLTSGFAPFINVANINEFTKEFNEGHYAIERNANPTILLMDISLKATKLLKIKPE
ncbi:MAG: DNA polymerase III subunit delta [Bacteroidetes bacterium]|nr:DNA polymerase III subunit delta [Bacteroidota bacterium]